MPDKMTIELRHLKKSPDEVRIWNHQGIFLFYPKIRKQSQWQSQLQ